MLYIGGMVVSRLVLIWPSYEIIIVMLTDFCCCITVEIPQIQIRAQSIQMNI